MKQNLSKFQLGFQSVTILLACAAADGLYGAGTITTQADLITALNSGSGTYTFANNITLTQNLPVRSGNIQFDGANFTVDGGGRYQIFFVQSGTMTLQNISLINGVSQGGAGGNSAQGGGGGGGGLGAGGALFVNSSATVYLQGVNFTANKAQGGNGGTGGQYAGDYISGPGGGGGGGLRNNSGGAGGDSFKDGNPFPSTAGGAGGGGAGIGSSGSNGAQGFTTATTINSATGASGGANTAGAVVLGGAGVSVNLTGTLAQIGNAGFNGASSGQGGGGASGGVSNTGATTDGTQNSNGNIGGNGQDFGGGGGGSGGGGKVGLAASLGFGASGGNGGFGAGGGGAGTSNQGGLVGGIGGFGAAGGGGGGDGGGAGGYGGGKGDTGYQSTGGGGGGAAFGGAVFVRQGGQILITDDVSYASNTLAAGVKGSAGAVSGTTDGQDLYLVGGSTLSFSAPVPGGGYVYNGVISGGINESGTTTTGCTLNIDAGLGSIVTLAGTNTFFGTTNINSGILAIASQNVFGATLSSIKLNGTTTQAQLMANNNITLGQGLTITGSNNIIDTKEYTLGFSNTVTCNGPFTKTGTGTLAFAQAVSLTGPITIGVSNGLLSFTTIHLTSGATTFDVANIGSTAISAPIDGSGSIVKTGAGVLTLSQANLYSGGTTVNAGTVSAGSGSSFGTGTVTLLGGAIIDLQPSLNVLNAVNLSTAATSAAIINISSGSSSLSGVIAGASQQLKKTGTGTLVLTGVNTYSGDTDIFEGVLVIKNTAGSGNYKTTQTAATTIQPQLTIQGPATFNRNVVINNVGTTGFIIDAELNTSITGTFTSLATDKLILTTNTLATMTLGASNPAFVGTLQLNSGNISISDENRLGTSTLAVILNGVTLTGAVSSISKNLNVLSASTLFTGNMTISGVLSGGGSLSLQSNLTTATTITLSGDNTPYIGAFVLGTPTVPKILSVSDSKNIGGTTLISMNSGSTLDFQGNVSSNTFLNFSGAGTIQKNSYNVTMGGPIIGSGSITITGNNTLRLAGNNSKYTGNIYLQAGSLTFRDPVNSPDNLGSGTYFPSASVTLGLIQGMTLSNPFDLSNSGAGSNISIATGTATLNGIISGASKLLTKQGAGRVDLEGPNASYSWALRVSQGTTFGAPFNYPPSLTIDGGASAILDVVENEIEDLSTKTLNGAGQLEKSGQGILDLRAAPSGSFTGNYLISEGTARVLGNFTNDFIVNGSAVLEGNGGVGDLSNNGNVRPGSSIGTLTVNGNYIQLSEGNLEIEINSQGQSDLLRVQAFGGSLGDLDLDGTVSVLQSPGYYPNGTRYRFLTYTGSRTGVFSRISAARGELFYLWYDDPTHGTLELEILSSHFIPPIANQDLTGYARAVAFDLFCLPFPVDAPSLGLLEVLIPLVNLPADQYREALVTIANGQISGLTTFEFENNFRLLQSSMLRWDRNDERACYDFEDLPKTTFWVNPLGFGMWQNTYQDCKGFFSDTFGITAGAEHRFSSEGKAGIFGGYSRSKLHWKDGVGKTSLKEVYFGPYLGAQWNGWTMALGLMGSIDSALIERQIFWSGFSSTATSKPTLFNASANLDLAGRFQIADPLYVEPEASIGAVQTICTSFCETGGSYFNTHVNRSYQSTLRSCLRLNMGTNTCTKSDFHGDMRLSIGAILTALLTPNTVSSNFIQASEFCNDQLHLYGMVPSIFMFEASTRAMVGFRENLKIGFDADYMVGDRSQVVQGTVFVEASF